VRRWCCPSAGGQSGSTSIFRSFRLLRVLKLAKSINSLRVLLSTVVECIGNVVYMTLLLFLFVFMFAVMGLQGVRARLHTVAVGVVNAKVPPPPYRLPSTHCAALVAGVGACWLLSGSARTAVCRDCGCLHRVVAVRCAVFAGTFSREEDTYHFGRCGVPASLRGWSLQSTVS